MPRQQKIIPIRMIKRDVYPMRGLLDGGPFNELVRSIKEQGVICPILVEEKGDQYILIAGHRRLAAAERCMLGEIPAQIVTPDENIGWGGAFAENIVRQDVSAIEEAAAMSDALNQGGYDVERLARACGRSAAWVEGRLEILNWPTDVQSAIHDRTISVSAARNIALIDEENERRHLLSYAIDNGVTARTTSAWLQAYKMRPGPVNPETTESTAPSNNLPPIEPYTPCVICTHKMRVVELRHLPVCPDCQPYLVELAASLRDAPDSATV